MVGSILSRPGSPRGLLDRFVAYLVLLVLSLVTSLPFLIMLLISLNGDSQWGWSPTVPPHFIPRHFTFHEYAYVITAFNFARYFANSAIVTVASTLGQLLLGSMAGFAFGRLRFPGRGVLFTILLMTLMIPPQALIVPRFLIIAHLKLLNTYEGIIAPSVVTAFSIFLIRQFSRTIPISLQDAAIIDGAGWWKVFTVVYVPLLTPALGTAAIITFVQVWNDFLWPLVVAQKEQMFTLQIGLAAFRTQRVSQWSALMAGTAITTIPTIVIFIVMQKYYVAGLTLGSVKE